MARELKTRIKSSDSMKQKEKQEQHCPWIFRRPNQRESGGRFGALRGNEFVTYQSYDVETVFKLSKAQIFAKKKET